MRLATAALLCAVVVPLLMAVTQVHGEIPELVVLDCCDRERALSWLGGAQSENVLFRLNLYGGHADKDCKGEWRYHDGVFPPDSLPKPEPEPDEHHKRPRPPLYNVTAKLGCAQPCRGICKQIFEGFNVLECLDHYGGGPDSSGNWRLPLLEWLQVATDKMSRARQAFEDEHYLEALQDAACSEHILHQLNRHVKHRSPWRNIVLWIHKTLYGDNGYLRALYEDSIHRERSDDNVEKRKVDHDRTDQDMNDFVIAHNIIQTYGSCNCNGRHAKPPVLLAATLEVRPQARGSERKAKLNLAFVAGRPDCFDVPECNGKRPPED